MTGSSKLTRQEASESETTREGAAIIDEQKEQELWQMYEQIPSQDNRNQLVEFYFPRVKPLAWKKWSTLPMSAKRMIDEQDLESAGAIGLMQSIERYDRRTGVKFMTFATHRVRGQMLDLMRQYDHISRSHRRKVEFPPSLVSLSAVVRGKSGSKVVDVQSNIESYASDPSDEYDNLDELYSIICSLPAQYAAVVIYYHIDGLTMKQTGVVLGLSGSRVSQINSQAESLIRKIVKNRQRQEDLATPLR